MSVEYGLNMCYDMRYEGENCQEGVYSLYVVSHNRLDIMVVASLVIGVCFSLAFYCCRVLTHAWSSLLFGQASHP